LEAQLVWPLVFLVSPPRLRDTQHSEVSHCPSVHSWFPAAVPSQVSILIPKIHYTSTDTPLPAIVAADSYSRRFERSRNPEYQFQDESENLSQTLASQKTAGQRAMTWAADNRYSIVFGSWIASMGGALTLVGRNPYLTGQQKLVQARVYAQGLTMAVVIASLAFEGVDSAQGKGRWETVRYVDPNDPEHKHVIEKKIHHEKYKGEDQWMDMVAAEEERLKEREEAKEEHAQKNKKDNQHKEEPKSKKEEIEQSVSKSKKTNAA